MKALKETACELSKYYTIIFVHFSGLRGSCDDDQAVKVSVTGSKGTNKANPVDFVAYFLSIEAAETDLVSQQ